MASGVQVDSEAVTEYYNLQKGKKYKFITMGFNDKQDKVVLKRTAPPDATFEDLLKDLPRDHVRYIFYDCAYNTTGGQARNKLLGVTWSDDDNASGKEKMLVTTTKKEVESKCKEYAKFITINDYDELTEENFINLVSDNRSK